jgi:signal transduction histidine kinase
MQASIPAQPESRIWRRGTLGDWREVRLPAMPCLWHMRRPWLVVAGVLVAVGGLLALAEGPQWRSSALLGGVNLACSLAYVFTALLLCKESGQRVTAMALFLAGVFRCLGFADAWHGAWPAYTLVFGGIDRVFGAWALLRYPNSALTRPHRRFLLTLAGWMLGGRILLEVTSRARWAGYPAAGWWPALFPRQQLSAVLNYTVHGGEGLFGLTLIALLVVRLRQTRGLDRLVITPIIGAGIAAVVAAIVSAFMMTLSQSGTPNDAYLIEALTDFAIPGAFLVAVVQRLLLIRNVTELTAQVAAGGDIGAVRRALRSVLHDPTLDLVEGTEPGLRAPAEGRSERLVSYIHAGAGEPIAMVVADPVLARYRELFDAATMASGLALRNAQLQAKSAQERLEQVKASRVRIMEAELAERRRLERDLHDGVQQHLLGIAACLTAASTRTADPGAADAFALARTELRAVLGELRDLAHGIHPALLSQSGLGAALNEVAGRLPLPVRVTVPAARLDPALEATLYFVACEALANVVKHAGAKSVRVTVRTAEAVPAGKTAVELEITDDGAGGAPDGTGDPRSGHGLANMTDRVGALDGELLIDSPPGLGTRLIARVPCG